MAGSLTSLDRNRLDRLAARLDRSDTLQAGDTGVAVQALENILSTLGFTPGTVDGNFDARTRGTLKNFQASMGLEATGALDKRTLTALRTALTGLRELPGAVRRGQKGDDIARAERQLARLGYDVGARDGIADAQLGSAIVAFKEDQGNFDNQAPLLSLEGLSVLDRESDALRHAPWRGRRELTAQEHRFDQVLADLAKAGTLGEGARRPAVGQLQARLKAAGFDPQRTDGVFDERTRGALQAFQRASGVEPTGRLDTATWRHLSRTIIDSAEPASPAQRVGERSSAVRRTERLLQKAGFDPGEIDGLYSPATARAVRAFERRTQRPVNGELGERDLAGLKKFAANPFREPPADYRRLAWRGVTANARTIEMVRQAEAWAAKRGVAPGWPMFQGSYNTSVDASANTHAGGGALDFNTEGRSPRTIRIMVEALRRAGFAAWHRPAGGVSDEDHIHAIAIGDREMSSDARGQVREYFAGGDGLIGSAPDPHRAIGRPIPEWAKKFR